MSIHIANKQRRRPKSTVRKTTGLSPHEVYSLLRKDQGLVEWQPRFDPISELVFTILSQHTSDINAFKAFDRLRGQFGSWETVLYAEEKDIANLIHVGGLSNIKAPRIKSVLNQIKERRGNLSIDFLKQLPLDEAKAWLKKIPGIGPKTAAIVLAFSLGMPAMPVDTHIFRVSKRLGLIGPKINVDEAHEIIESQIKQERVFAFHVYLINHGRTVCKARKPLCGGCVLNKKCPSAYTL